MAKEENKAPRVEDASSDIRFLLASGSQRRRDVMRLAGLNFAVQTTVANSREAAAGFAVDAADLAQTNAVSKLRAAIETCGKRLPWNVAIMAADTVVSFEGDSLGKPKSSEEAWEVLRRLRGCRNEVVTSVATTISPYRQAGECFTRTVASQVLMRDYSDSEIGAYLACGSAFDRAGSYGVQDRSFNPVAQVVGCYLNVIGMPLCAVRSMLPATTGTMIASHIYATCLAHEEANAR